MAGLARLPLELVLSVVEHAAWGSEPSQSWVASLRLVNRVFDRVVAPALFETVEVSERNIGALAGIATQTNSLLRMTLRVYFLSDAVAREPASMYYYDAAFAPFVSALHGIQEFTGPHRAFARFQIIHRHRRLSSVFLVDPVTPGLFLSITSTHNIVQNLHLVVAMDRVRNIIPRIDFTRISAPYVVIDASSTTERDEQELETEFTVFVEELAKVLHRSSLRRLLIRIRVGSLPVETQAALGAVIQRWGVDTRDERVWLDESSPVASPLPSDEGVYDRGPYRADVYAGRGLWMTGRQLYSVPRGE
ncbi:hypothetical protein EXIGLDRAFT_731395 [Exidia glandulosa HHB12029]|uniref:F-box domain-containing protein n=1 Tax=Exidia glandulosa HHB12029 TaxID=1314781 RepID=A0A165BWC6_EXIGL|nr:hypothetical protein EXIGLDRAFT_731395 [Exidia glandulosa HHB12029]